MTANLTLCQQHMNDQTFQIILFGTRHLAPDPIYYISPIKKDQHFRENSIWY